MYPHFHLLHYTALDESLSGSASSSSEADEDDKNESSDDAVSNIIRKQKKLRLQSQSNAESDDDEEGASTSKARSPLIWFQSQSPNSINTQYGIYNVIFPASFSANHRTLASAATEYESYVKKMQDGGENGRMWALFMTAGGHFAGMIVRVSKPGSGDSISDAGTGKKAKSSKNVPDLEILAHKTFHRYTSRFSRSLQPSIDLIQRIFSTSSKEAGWIPIRQ